MTRDNLLPYALTTLQRVKDRIFDVNKTFSFTGNTTNGSATVSSVTVPSGLLVGQAIFGTGIPFGAYILAIGANTLTLSANATADGTATAITVYNQNADFDNVLIRMINSATDWFERQCGARRFVQTKYTNEVYSAVGAKQRYLVTKQCPINTFITTGNISLGSSVISGIPSTAGMQAGMVLVNYTNFPIGLTLTIVSVDSSTQITVSQTANASVTGMTFQVNGLCSFEWRAGTPNAPSWTSFVPDQFELQQDGKAGIIRIYGVMPRLYDNMARVTYWAGFPVDWANAGNGISHQLPSEVSDTVENLVVRRFKRRQFAGKVSEGLEGATTSWDKELEMEDKETIEHWRMTPAFF